MTIRKARKGEFRLIRALIATEPKELLQKNLPKLRDFWVAEQAGQLAGCGAVVVDGPRPEVRSFVVLKQFRENGIASGLLNACIQDARKRTRRRKGKFELMVVTGKPGLFERAGFGSTNGRKHYALFLGL
jgi:N-acetylglutamate synthase-like GNAT family acetyltransferase